MIGYIRHHPIRFDSIRFDRYIFRAFAWNVHKGEAHRQRCVFLIYIYRVSQNDTQSYLSYFSPLIITNIHIIFLTSDDSLLIYQGTIIYLIFELKDFFISLQLSFSPFVPIKKKLPLV